MSRHRHRRFVPLPQALWAALILLTVIVLPLLTHPRSALSLVLLQLAAAAAGALVGIAVGERIERS